MKIDTFLKINRTQKKLSVSDFAAIFGNKAKELYKHFEYNCERNLCAFIAELPLIDQINFIEYLKTEYEIQ